MHRVCCWRLFNLLLHWATVPSLLKLGIVVPIFKLGDPSMPDNYRPVSLACCCFKILEHVVPAWIAVHISSQVDHLRVASGGEQMPWLVLSSMSCRRGFHPRTCRLRGHQEGVRHVLGGGHSGSPPGVTGKLLVFFAHFLCHTQSQVQLGALLSEPSDDRDIAQDRVLSPLFLIFSLTASPMQSTSPLQV